MSMQPCPGSAFEVVKPKLLLELLVCLFIDPSGFDTSPPFVVTAGHLVGGDVEGWSNHSVAHPPLRGRSRGATHDPPDHAQ
jgi:hypothetical protein